MGPMEYENGNTWRIALQERLKSLKIHFFNPYSKPFIEYFSEDESARMDLKGKMAARNFEPVHEVMKKVRADDLRLCDISDFGIARIVPTVPTFGTMEEISWFVRCKKPLFIYIEGGKEKTPLWLTGMIPDCYIFDSQAEVEEVIIKISKGSIPMDDSRWRLLRKEFR